MDRSISLWRRGCADLLAACALGFAGCCAAVTDAVICVLAQCAAAHHPRPVVLGDDVAAPVSDLVGARAT